MNFNRKKMKQTAFLAIVAVVLSCIGCKKEDIHSNELTGTWIEATDKADTLVFFGTESFMLNNYYFEIKNGTLKIGDFYRKNLTQQGTLTFVKQ